MTDAQNHIAADRRPEFGDAAGLAVAAERAAAVPTAPRNPWLASLVLIWVSGASIALILWIAGASVNTGGDYYSSGTDDPAAQSGLYLVGLIFTCIAVLAFLLWVTAKALAWRPPGSTES